MRRSFLVLGAAATLGLASAPAFASPEAMTPAEARHLISRSGFGAAPQEIAAFTGLSYAEGVTRILGEIAPEPASEMPAWTKGWPYPQEAIWALGQTTEEAFYSMRWIDLVSLQQWWLAEMIATPTPLTERLTLFWHDHFATSYDSAEDVHWIADQNALLRRHAAGNFGDLAAAILRDPAMLVYLTNTENSAEAPNENLAREFLELFTLGEGRGYTEEDVRQAARALTGHSIAELSAPVYEFYPDMHDDGRKTILGETGRHDAQDLARIVLKRPEFGPYIVEKLWLEFVSDRPDPAEIDRLTKLWKAENLELRPLLKALFLTDAFWAPENRGRLVKSPIELFVGTVRSLGIEVPNLQIALWMLEELGQQPFFPPNVGGWPTGTGWINDATVSARAMGLTYLLDWDFEDGRDAAAPMMMLGAAPGAAAVGDLAPGDLRVGQVFAISAEAWEGESGGDETGALLTLYDVGWNGQDWRSISLWIEEVQDEPVGIGLYTADCDCLGDWPMGEDGWAWFAPWDDIGDDLRGASPDDLALVQTVIAHLPALIEGTQDHVVWDPRFRAGEDLPPMKMSEITRVAETLRQETAAVIGLGDGALVLATGPMGNLGFGGAQSYLAELEAGRVSGDETDEMLEALEIASIQSAAPAVIYDSAADWLAALPGGGLQSVMAEGALLAVPLPEEGRRLSMVEDDPEAMIRAFVLHPHFQVN